jgi:hypothetical protein
LALDADAAARAFCGRRPPGVDERALRGGSPVVQSITSVDTLQPSYSLVARDR